MEPFDGPKVYIAGPYTKGDPPTNVAVAIQAFNDLADSGFAPFCPHLSMFPHMHKPRSWQWWLRYDLAWLERCDCLVRLPGESKGAEVEVAYMLNLGKPVFDSVESVKEHYGLQGRER